MIRQYRSRKFERGLKIENKIRRFIRKVGIHVPNADPTLHLDFMLGLDFSKRKLHPSIPTVKIGDFLKNKLSGKIGEVYRIKRRNGRRLVAVRFPNQFNVEYVDNGFDGYLLTKVKR